MNVETPIWQCCVMVNALFVVLIYQNVLTSFLLENCLSLFIYFSTFFIGKFLFPLDLKMKPLINPSQTLQRHPAFHTLCKAIFISELEH